MSNLITMTFTPNGVKNATPRIIHANGGGLMLVGKILWALLSTYGLQLRHEPDALDSDTVHILRDDELIMSITIENTPSSKDMAMAV